MARFDAATAALDPPFAVVDADAFDANAATIVRLAAGNAQPARLPTPVHPAGLSLLPTEGANEGQTPLAGTGADSLKVGDRVWWRHAKAGQLCEHVGALHVVRRDVIERSVPTYRGEDAPAFLWALRPGAVARGLLPSPTGTSATAQDSLRNK
jgi:D-serine deaminase-like pyridoxal phosphate-dependent protein